MTGHAASHVYFGWNAMWVSTCVLAATYAVIMSEKVNRAIIALVVPDLDVFFKILAVNNKTRAPAAPDIPTAREAGYPSLELEGLIGLFGLKSMPNELKEKIAADFREAAADGSIAERLKSTGQVINVGGPKEFADSISEQRANVATVVKAIGFKPRN